MNDFAAGASQLGQGIAGFFNPIVGGTTTTTTTTAPSNNYMTIGLIVVGLCVAGYFLFKK